MARHKKQTVDYFPHDAKSGKTIYILESYWGNDGYAFWFKLLETLCATPGHLFVFKQGPDLEYFLAKTRVQEAVAIQILDKLSELGNIDPKLWKSRQIWCQNLVDNLADVYKNRKSELPTPEIISTTKNAISTNRNAISTGKNAISTHINRQRKGKERKGEERKGKGTEKPAPLSPPFSGTDFLALWKTKCPNFKTPQTLSPQLLEKAMSKDLAGWEEVFERMSKSKFLCGQNARKWIPSLNWILESANAEKVMNGNYDDESTAASEHKKQKQEEVNAMKKIWRESGLSDCHGKPLMLGGDGIHVCDQCLSPQAWAKKSDVNLVVVE
jgi:hypothetical protein